MKACILYRPNSEFARIVEEYARDFKRSRGIEIDLIDLNTRDGASTASIYDIVRYPSVMIIKDDGQLIKEWQGEIFPLMSELAVYLV